MSESNPTPSAEQLTAIEACREAARRYAYGVDRLDADVMKSAYWPDATDDHGVFVGNAWEFCDRVVATHGSWEWTMHTTFNHRVEIDAGGTSARGEAFNIAYLFDGENRRLSTWYGRYLDRYEQRNGEWRIAHRVCVHNGTTVSDASDAMAIPAERFRQGSFDRPSTRRPIGP